MNDGRQLAAGTLPDIVVERFVLGELPAADVGQVRRVVERDTALGARIDAIGAGDRAGLEWLAAGVSARLRRADPRVMTGRVRQWSLPLAAAAVMAVIVASALVRSGPEERIKGPDAMLAIYRQTTLGSEQLRDGAVARPGDVIRIGYKVSAPGFGVIASVDGRGLVTVHHPGDGITSVPLQT
jgi:hypothetical protein